MQRNGSVQPSLKAIDMKGHSESILQSQLSVIDTGEPLAPEFELFSEGDEL